MRNVNNYLQDHERYAELAESASDPEQAKLFASLSNATATAALAAALRDS